MSPLWLYAIGSGKPEGIPGPGLAGEPLEWLQHGALAALVGRPPALPEVARGTLEAHDAVVRRASLSQDALLPARFGQGFEGEEALRQGLTELQGEILRALERVSGCVQMTLRVFGDGSQRRPLAAPEEPAEEPASASPRATQGAGARYLALRRQLHRGRTTLPEAQELLEELAPMVREERIHREPEGVLVGTAYHLVPRDTVDDYRSAVERHRPRLLPLRLSLAGPSPTYAFAPPERR